MCVWGVGVVIFKNVFPKGKIYWWTGEGEEGGAVEDQSARERKDPCVHVATH